MLALNKIIICKLNPMIYLLKCKLKNRKLILNRMDFKKIKFKLNKFKTLRFLTKNLKSKGKNRLK